MILCTFLVAIIGSVLIILLTAVQVRVSPGMDPSQTLLGDAGLVRTLLQVMLYLAMTFSMLKLFKIVYKRPLKEIGLSRKNCLKELGFGGLFGIILITAVFLILLGAGQLSVDAVNLGAILSSGVLAGLVQFILVGFFEEILGRGYIMTAFKTTRNKYVIILSSSLIFSLMHISNPNVTALSLLNIFLVGMLFAFMFIKTGRLWAPIGMHITWNFFQGNIFGINVSGLETASVIESSFTGLDFLTGGEFGAEGGLVVTAVTLIAIAYMLFKFKQPDERDWSLDSGLPFAKNPETEPQDSR
jgi:membrane protease YdiL (CAAX protease family)